MKYFIIFFSLILPNLAFTKILEKFPLACICDKSINALKYFDCKQKVSGTQLDIIENNVNGILFKTNEELKQSINKIITDDEFSDKKSILLDKIQ